MAALTGIGAARVPTSTHESLCAPVLLTCDPTPSPAPAPIAPAPGLGSPPLGTLAPTVPTGPSSATSAPPGSPDPGAPTFTQPAAQLTGSSITFTGLHSVTPVTVALANGSRIPVIKLSADDIVINDFHLTVRKETGPALVSDSARMELRGNIQVYVDSVTASLLDGTPLTLGASTPAPDKGLPPSLLRVNLGLVGVTADSITFTPSHQELK